MNDKHMHYWDTHANTMYGKVYKCRECGLYMRHSHNFKESRDPVRASKQRQMAAAERAKVSRANRRREMAIVEKQLRELVSVKRVGVIT